MDNVFHLIAIILCSPLLLFPFVWKYAIYTHEFALCQRPDPNLHAQLSPWKYWLFVEHMYVANVFHYLVLSQEKSLVRTIFELSYLYFVCRPYNICPYYMLN